MTVRHYHLRTASAAPSERWREAFPAGEALDAAALAARLGSGDRRECMVWLGTDDRQWPEQVQRIRRTAPAAHVVVLTGQPGEREALQAMGAGASGYAHSHAVPALLREVALVVEHGGLWLGPALMQRVLGAAAGVLPAGREEPGLSRREAEVAKAVAAGRSNKVALKPRRTRDSATRRPAVVVSCPQWGGRAPLLNAPWEARAAALLVPPSNRRRRHAGLRFIQD